MKRVMKKQAKAAAKNAASGVPAAGTMSTGERAVGDVHRDGKGGLWRDQDEEMEYAPLLGSEEGEGAAAEGWIQFDSEGEEIPAIPSSTMPSIPAITVTPVAAGSAKKPRRRPAPLKLASAHPVSSPSSPNEELGFGDSFDPSPIAVPASAPATAAVAPELTSGKALKKQRSRMDVRNLFGIKA